MKGEKMNRPLIYHLHDPAFWRKDYKCFYCGAILEEGEECECKKDKEKGEER